VLEAGDYEGTMDVARDDQYPYCGRHLESSLKGARFYGLGKKPFRDL